MKKRGRPKSPRPKQFGWKPTKPPWRTGGRGPESHAFGLIRRAIESRRPIEVMYDGKLRYLCPHVLGYKVDEEMVLAYQYDGQSESGIKPTPPDQLIGHPDNWRCLVVSKLSGLVVLDVDEWHTADNHSRPSTCIGEVAAEVEY